MLLKPTLGSTAVAVSLRISLLITRYIMSAADPHYFIMFCKLLPNKLPFDITTISLHMTGFSVYAQRSQT